MILQNIKGISHLTVSICICVISLLISCSTPTNMFSFLSSSKDVKAQKPPIENATKNKHESFSTPTTTSINTTGSDTNKTYSLQSAIHVIDSNTFRIEISYPTVWDSLLSVLIRNYNIILADSTSGIITTDWDSFYLKENTLRNRISVKVKKLSYNNTELIFHNSVESLKTTTSYVWLPEPDKYNEIERIMNNMAILLNQPPVKISHLNIGSTKKVIQK